MIRNKTEDEEALDKVSMWLLQKIKNGEGWFGFSSGREYLLISPTKVCADWIARYRLDSSQYYMVCDDLRELITETFGYDLDVYYSLSVTHFLAPPQEFLDYFEPFLVMEEMK